MKMVFISLKELTGIQSLAILCHMARVIIRTCTLLYFRLTFGMNALQMGGTLSGEARVRNIGKRS